MFTADMMFADYIRFWLDGQRQFLQITTWEGYDIIISNHVLPFYQSTNLKLTDVKGYHLQDYYNAMLGGGLSPSTLKKHNAVLHKAFADAVFMDLLEKNPCDKTRLPKKCKYHSHVYSDEDVVQLLKACKSHYLETPILLTAYYGLRRSEVLGLKWSDISFTGNTLSISRSLTRVKTSVCKDSLKNESSYRVFPLVPAVAEYLQNLECRQKALKIYGADDFLCKYASGAVISPNALSKGFNRLLKKSGLPVIRFHDLRHSNISILLNHGMSLKHISAWAGHSNISITADLYSHLDFTSKIKMGNKIDELLGGRSE